MNDIEYTLIRSARKTAAITIKDGRVTVRVPASYTDEDAKRIIKKNIGWIKNKLSDFSSTAPLGKVKLLTNEERERLIRKAEKEIPERVAHYAPIVGVDYKRISIRSQRTRWGSCSSAGNLNFNCMLMLAPPEALDYVVVHELCHRKHMNHSDAFWKEVARVMPDYEKPRQWLRGENGRALIRRLPE